LVIVRLRSGGTWKEPSRTCSTAGADARARGRRRWQRSDCAGWGLSRRRTLAAPARRLLRPVAAAASAAEVIATGQTTCRWRLISDYPVSPDAAAGQSLGVFASRVNGCTASRLGPLFPTADQYQRAHLTWTCLPTLRLSCPCLQGPLTEAGGGPAPEEAGQVQNLRAPDGGKLKKPVRGTP
jgi:hypothetical protein